MAAESRALKFLVSGKVQGVYFRGSAAAEANRLGLTGWAKNLPDGRVEVVACGDPQSLSDFTDWLWKGPPSAVVEGVRAELRTDADIGPGFDVR